MLKTAIDRIMVNTSIPKKPHCSPHRFINSFAGKAIFSVLICNYYPKEVSLDETVFTETIFLFKTTALFPHI